jgi:hypothetical protein
LILGLNVTSFEICASLPWPHAHCLRWFSSERKREMISKWNCPVNFDLNRSFLHFMDFCPPATIPICRGGNLLGDPGKMIYAKHQNASRRTQLRSSWSQRAIPNATRSRAKDFRGRMGENADGNSAAHQRIAECFLPSGKHLSANPRF